MIFEEALHHPGPLLAAWDLTSEKGERTLTLFSLENDRLRLLAHRSAPAAQEAGLADALRARGVAVGECDSRCDFAWLNAADGVTVWSPRGRVLRASGDTVVLADGRTVARAALEVVYAYAADDYVRRGVRARLRTGEEVSLVREVSSSAAADPTYSRNELLYDTEWAGAIAAAVAAWAGVPYENHS